ncbi:inner membrane protein PPF-1, chloroplastic, partial [Tanacetum coccineum]
MAKSLISSPSSFIGTPLTSLTRHNNRLLSNRTKFISTRVKFSYNGIPPLSEGVNVDFAALVSRAESVLYTLADAAVVAVDGASGGGDTTAATTTTVQKAGGWFGFISDAMEVVLK